jgi:hypothetical protein
LVQTLRAQERSGTTEGEFSAAREFMRKQYQVVFAKAVSAAQDDLDSAVSAIGDKTGIPDLKLKIGEVKPLEIFEDTSMAMSVLLLTSFEMQASGKLDQVPLVMSAAFALVKGKLLYFGAYSGYHSSQDADWVRSQTRDWLSRVAKAN